MLKKIIKIILILLLLSVLIISSFLLYKELKEDTNQENIFEEIQEIVQDNNVEQEENNKEADSIDISKLYEQNKDIIAWIKINDSNINYPIMQTKNNPNFYLRRNFYKNYSYYGTPYMAEQCNINTSDNLIIYGHHIRNNKMFGELEDYRNKEYYENHKNIELYTLDGKKDYEIVYVFKTIANKGFDYYHYIDFKDESEFTTFNNKCKELAFFNIQIQCKYGDKFITLSTCDYTSKNGRLVVVARQINMPVEEIKEEQIEVQEVKEENTNKVENIKNEDLKEVIKNKEQTNKTTNKNVNVEKKQNTITTTQKTISSSYNESYFENGHLKSYPSFSSKYATLKISKIGVNAPIYFGLTQDILLKGVAHDSGSYFSGENGSIILAGHNYMNNFKRLGELKAGDIIEIKTEYGEFKYKVTNSKVIKDTQLEELPIQKGNEKLMIYTCYPFNSRGYTEYRYVVYADKI